MNNYLFLIPARGGSKGIPGKNIKPLKGKPLIYYSIDVARSFASDEDICVSTDDQKIIQCVNEYGLKTPFIRPPELATDTADSNNVILHALNYYEQIGKKYKYIVLLQPTSPFRTLAHIQEATSLISPELDMIVSVKETKSNPYYLLYEENQKGFLQKSKEKGTISRRQDVPTVYELNGSIYIINVQSLENTKNIGKFEKIKKYIMDEGHSVDLDTMLDWNWAEFLLEKKIVII